MTEQKVRTVQGRVVSNKMDKTITVVVERCKTPYLREVHQTFY